MRSIYLDYNATTPLDPAVREAMLPFLGELFGNPSSLHRHGRAVRAFLDDARERVASLWRCKPSEVVFTGGGTEANNLAVLGAARALSSRGGHLITSAIEHPSVLRPMKYLAEREGFTLTLLPVDACGRVDPADVSKSLRADTILVSVMAANNEVGTLQPVAEIGRICRERGVVFHTDAAQWFGKEPVPDINIFNADLVTFCPHKLYGPKGAGALFIRSPLALDPLLRGGGQENDRRAGTENVAAIAGLVEALWRFGVKPAFDRSLIGPLSERLATGLLAMPGMALAGPALTERLANTTAITVEACDSLTLLAGLDLQGISASSGSACSAGSLEPSHVLAAMGIDPRRAKSFLRFSVGRDTTLAEIDTTLEVLADVISQARRSE